MSLRSINLARTINLRTASCLPAIAMRHNSTSSKQDDAKADKVKQITVFGAGLMGAGIAQVAAQNGYKVILSDVTEQALDNGLQIINKSLARVAKKLAPKAPEGTTEESWKRNVLERIQTTSDPEGAVQNSDLVIEAIIENVKIKQNLFGFLDSRASKDCIFASNTSSLSISEIASSCSEARQNRFAGLHFFNPVPAMRLVEIIKAPKTDPEVIEILKVVTARMGKSPVHCVDTPGLVFDLGALDGMKLKVFQLDRFIVNRLLIPYLMESVRMVERGEATPEDIDTAMELGTGYPMGPFKLLDFVGLDTTSYIGEGWQEKAKQGLISEELVKPSPLLQKMIKEGRLGRKSGKGFYDYSSKL